MRSLIFILVICILACSVEKHTTLRSGDYRVTMITQDDELLPFNFKLRTDGVMEIYNAEEVIEVNDIQYFNDSIRINFPIYEGYIAGMFENGEVSGAKFIKESLDRIVDVHFEYGVSERNINLQPTNQNISGIWEMNFTEEDGKTFIAKGIFDQLGQKVTGTIRTTTGDHRYLEGALSDTDLKLSAFDGAHAFLYTADVDGDKMQGAFYYGNHYKSTFVAHKNMQYELPHEDSLTFLKEGYDRFDFSFPNLNDEVISLSDDRYKDKVVVVQILGSWCPNCLDECKYYVEYLNKNPNPNLEFVGLAFEYARTKEKAFESLRRLKTGLDIEYPLLLAQQGSSDKGKAQEKLPMLNHVLSYPTTIFIDKKGAVRKIHTGFNGPATGQKYLDYKVEFENFVQGLLLE